MEFACLDISYCQLVMYHMVLCVVCLLQAAGQLLDVLEIEKPSYRLGLSQVRAPWDVVTRRGCSMQ